jgi:chemotaxis protein methyltransferase CheR
MTLIARPEVDCLPVLNLVRQRAGLSFPGGRQASAEATIRRAMEGAGLSDPLAYCGRLRTDAAAWDALLDGLTVGETYFFREPTHFEFVRQRILPELARRAAGHLPRVWSAGCASGEEPYSLAILLEEAGFDPAARVLATDVSPAALVKARRAVYRQWSLRGAGRDLALPYLERRGETFTLNERIRRRVLFEPLNLALDTFPALATGTWGVDLLLCRNVLIYFDREVVGAVARRLFDSLAPGGWLITASSDPPLGEFAAFEVLATEGGIFYRRPTSVAELPGAAPCVALRWEATIEYPEHLGLGPTPPGAAPASPTLAASATVRPSAACPHEPGDIVPDNTSSATGIAAQVRLLANQDVEAAARLCAEGVRLSPLSTELHYLHGVLLLGLGQDAPAAEALRKALFLDRSLAIAHFTLAGVLERMDDLAGARRALRNAAHLANRQPADAPVPLGDGERFDRLAEAATAQLALLDPSTGPDT